MIFNAITKLGSFSNDAKNNNKINNSDSSSSSSSFGNNENSKFVWKTRWTTYKSYTLYTGRHGYWNSY
ncbi:expressed protein [Dictyostelium purpureum]|uniref:Expressed protein n=1 Tax=Dictyostelium purpureum TaxID=5786 RepID=F0ZNT7_DICPU|nr:uncharacterized protein DICPUDRAFT_92227 [Dictyostelium purpureum]EGC34396.1 expressed protein [Dictyostelium purpureum]|eukprot:XP_003289070.1 expressed protein [Dictyostelium purpureum]